RVLSAPALGNLARDPERADSIAPLVPQRQLGCGNPPFRAVGQRRMFLDVDQGPSGLDDLLLVLEGLFGVFLGEEIEVGLSDGFRGVIQPEPFRLGSAGSREASLPILAINAV